MPELNYDPVEVAIGTVAILIAAIVIFAKRKHNTVVGNIYWTAEAYYNHLKKNIILANNMGELSALKASIEGFRVKTFRGFFRRDRRRYYKQLKEAYELKERNLILHPKPQQLCKS